MRNTLSDKPQKKERFTVHLPPEIIREARDTVITLKGPPLQLTLSELVENSLRRELKRLKKSHNQGRDFPKYSGKLKAGRPVR